MTNKPIDAPDAYATPVYVQAMEIPAGARVLTVSGQVGAAPDGTVPDDFAGQARQALANLEAQLRVAGMAKTDIAKLTIILTDAANIAEFRAIRNDWLGTHRTASTLIIAGLAEPRWLVEVEAIAAH